MASTRGLLIIVTGPSAVGKGAICQALLKRTSQVRFSVSVTTRAPRPGEADGVQYFFISHAEFMRRRDADELLEWAEVYGNWYGTPRAAVAEATGRGDDIILDIDIVGATAVRERFPEALSVFVIPPSMAELAARIRKRGTEDPEAVQRRLNEAPRWIREGLKYDYVLVNDDLDGAVERLQAVIVAEKCRTERGGAALIQRLLEKGALDPA